MSASTEHHRSLHCDRCDMTFDFPGMIKHVTVIHGVRFPAGAHRSGTTYLTMKDGVLRYENRFVWQFVTDGELVLIWEHSKGPA